MTARARGLPGRCGPGPVAEGHSRQLVIELATRGGRVGAQPACGRRRRSSRAVTAAGRHWTSEQSLPRAPRRRGEGVHRGVGRDPDPKAKCGRCPGPRGGPGTIPGFRQRGRTGAPGNRVGHVSGTPHIWGRRRGGAHLHGGRRPRGCRGRGRGGPPSVGVRRRPPRAVTAVVGTPESRWYVLSAMTIGTHRHPSASTVRRFSFRIAFQKAVFLGTARRAARCHQRHVQRHAERCKSRWFVDGQARPRWRCTRT